MISPRDKDIVKVLRSIVEGIILIVAFTLFIRSIFVENNYLPYDKNDDTIVTGEDYGFIGISYLGVDRTATETLIGVKRLQEQLKALYNNGYVTITQEDIESYYNKGMPLPRKAVFLMFEDGRRETSTYAQKVMEKFNYLGTMLSYAQILNERDNKFLKGKDLINLKKSTFWELGTNGYRSSYINVFDRYNNYLGELSSLEYYKLNNYLEKDYNRYLMDYIRDKNFIPIETYTQMVARINNDYELMKDTYTDKVDEVPKLYTLMHSSTGSYANNEKVSAVNETRIKDLFTINFNRDGYSLNNRKNNIYHLTRIQPQAFWYPNHLLMRIKNDTNSDMEFVDGDLKIKKEWEVINGAPEFEEPVIALTSESDSNGLIRLKKSKDLNNLELSVLLTGNKSGMQSIIMRADEELKQYVAVKLQKNIIYIDENGNQLFKLDLDEFDGVKNQSVEENKQEAQESEYELYTRNSSLGKSTNMNRQSKNYKWDAKSVEEGASEYDPPIQLNEAGRRKIKIKLKDDRITLSVDGKVAVKALALSGNSVGYIYLESSMGENQFSKRKFTDHVYDGVFENLKIIDQDGSSYTLYDNQLHGWEKVKTVSLNTWNNILNWFIKTF